MEFHSPFATHHSLSSSRFHRALYTRVHGIERGRATDIQPVALLAAEAQIGDGFRNVDLAEQFATGRVAAHAVLVGIAPADRAPDPPFGVAAHAVGDARLWHVREDLAVRDFSPRHVEVEDADMGGI